VQAGFFPVDYQASVAEHAALIEAVASGDAALAERLARTHNEAEVRLLAPTVEEEVADGAPA